MSAEKEKDSWDIRSIESFIIACLEQVSKGVWVGTSFSKNWWTGIASKFKELTGKSYYKIKFKNKFDNLIREWQVWYRLFGKEIGLRWDNAKSSADASDEWWEKKQLVCVI